MCQAPHWESKATSCANIIVNDASIRESEKEKNLGEFITIYANPKTTIEDRKRKGYGILSEITAILNDVPLGSKRFEMGMTLKQAWLINGTLYNSEVWCAFSKADIEVVEVLDPICLV